MWALTCSSRISGKLVINICIHIYYEVLHPYTYIPYQMWTGGP